MDGSEANDGGVDEDVGERGDTEEHEDRDEVAEQHENEDKVAELANVEEDGNGASHYQVPFLSSLIYSESELAQWMREWMARRVSPDRTRLGQSMTLSS